MGSALRLGQVIDLEDVAGIAPCIEPGSQTHPPILCKRLVRKTQVCTASGCVERRFELPLKRVLP